MSPVLCAHPCESCLNLICNNESTTASDCVHNHGNVAVYESVNSSDTLDGLKNNARNLATAVGIDNFQSVLLQAIHSLEGPLVLARPGEFLMSIASEHIARPSRHVGDRPRVTDQSVVAIPQAQEIVISCEDPGQTDSEIIGLTATIAKVHGIKIAAKLVAQHFGVGCLHVAEENLRDVAKSVGLLCDCLNESRMRVANRDGRNSGNPVLVSVALVVEKVLHLAFHHQQGLGVIMEVEPGHEIFSILDNLLEGDALVRLGLIIEARK